MLVFYLFLRENQHFNPDFIAWYYYHLLVGYLKVFLIMLLMRVIVMTTNSIANLIYFFLYKMLTIFIMLLTSWKTAKPSTTASSKTELFDCSNLYLK